MQKQNKEFEEIERLKKRYRKLTSEVIRKRLSLGVTIKESSIAYKEVLKERGEES